MPLLKSRREAASAAVEDDAAILELRRLTDHPQLKDLFARKERLAVKLAELTNSKRMVDDLLNNFQHAAALALAEADMKAVRRRDDLKAQSDQHQEQLALIEGGLEAINAELDNALSDIKLVAQAEISGAFVEPLASAIAGIQNLIDANERLKVVEGASARLLGTGKLWLWNAELTTWLSRLQHKLNLVAPR